MRRLLDLIMREPVLLTLVILSTGGVWVFVELAQFVTEGNSREFDEWTILALRNPLDKADPLGPRWFEEVMRDFTALGGYAILSTLTISVVVFLWIRDRHQMAVLVLTAVLGGIVFSTILKSVFDRPRPDLVPHGSFVSTKSFPSGHAMLSAATYLTLGAILAEVEKERRLRIFFLLLGVGITIIVGVSRVYLGVHWPTDVLAGWVAGAAWALACWTIANMIDRHRKQETI